MTKNSIPFSQFLNELDKIGNLEIAAQTIVDGFMLGIHQSPYHGFSAEFSQYRPYNTGDDIKHLDWKVLARSEKYYIKEYMEETNLRANIFLDVSNSMTYRERGEISKLEYGKYLAASLAFLLQRQNDAVGFASGGDKLSVWLRPSTKNTHLRELLNVLNNLKPDVSADLPLLLKDFSGYLPRAGMCIIISDFLCDVDDLFDQLKGIKHIGQDIILLQILDPMETDFGFKEEAEFIDMESKAQLKVSPKMIRKTYLRHFDAFLHKVHNNSLELGISHQIFKTDEDFTHPLTAFLMKRNKKN